MPLLFSIGSEAAPATVGQFTGGDPDEGLDMQGNFVYAVNVGPDGAAGKVGDADFTADSVAGVTVSAQNNIGFPGWLEAIYGETENDINLATVMNSIRWSAAPAEVTVRLAVTPGNEYKLQLLLGEDCCEGRGFNVIVEGVTEVSNLMPARIQVGDTGDFLGTKEIIGVVVTKEFVATSSEATFTLSGPAADSPDINDRNAILNGFTLEFLRVAPLNDTDSDGLADEWETRFFGDLTQTGATDFDSDGLTNREESDNATNPTLADTDGDGLSDSAEIKTHRTDPSKKDSDADGLADGDEINQYQTDPAKKDTDGDGATDYDEVRLFTNAKSADSKPTKTVIGTFTGADPGEGLDLQGNFIYAIDNGPEDSVGGQVGDALFLPELADPNAVVITSNRDANWNPGINYGDSADELTLAGIMSSISWSDWNRPTSEVGINLSNLVAGASYKLQLLFAEQAYPRGFDVHIDGIMVADDFSPAFYQGHGFPLNYPDTNGVVMTHTFVARTNNVWVVLDGKGTGTREFSDHNAIINGLTLEMTAAAADTDGDSLPDAWEIENFGNLAQTGSQDADNDTLSNAVEFADGTNPTKADTDNDGLSDAQEKTAGTKAGAADTDLDGLSDAAEVNTHQTDPKKWDTDNDGVSDGTEVNVAKTDPKKSETRVLVQAFTGGDAGEGLDLDGTFPYAFSILPDTGAIGQVRDANFTSENVPGVSVTRAVSQIVNWWVPEFGDSFNDDSLEIIVQNIRHGGGGADIVLSNLVTGTLYKLQLIFGEQGSPRGFDVLVNGKKIVDDFAPFITQGGINNTAAGAVISYEFIASDTVVRIQTMNTVSNPRYADTNPIINAVTLEEVAQNADSDGDGLSDPWETYYLGNLSANGTADADGDGLNNAGEFQLGTDPTVADADGDGLNDNGEKTAGTNPSVADTDGDGLMDGAEVNTHHTNPTAADADHDGLPDPTELALGSNPNVADTGVTVGAFTGGDAGEGLDLDGNFLYAFSVLPDTAAVGQVRDAVFTSENVPGVTVSQATSVAANWFVPDFGTSLNDDALEVIIQNIRHGGGGATVTLSNLTAGAAYKLQLLFGEACCSRAMDVKVDGKLVADEFAPYEYQGGTASTTKGAYVAYEFVAGTNRLVIQTIGSTVTTARFTDRNPIINAVTLESLGAPAAVLKVTGINRGANGFSVTFDSVSGKTYALEYKATLADPAWQDAGSIVATGASATLLDDNAAHRTPGSGFWRIRGQ